MFSSQGQVSSIIITFLVDLEKSNISVRRVETAKNTSTTNIPSKSNSKFQSEAECNTPRKPLGGAVILKHINVHWVSLERVVERILFQYSSLRGYFLRENASKSATNCNGIESEWDAAKRFKR